MFRFYSLYSLALGHVVLLTISNLLVQYPFVLFGWHTTWGAFSYPAIFILTDLTVRLSSPSHARLVILRSMFPAFALSYVIAVALKAEGGVTAHDWLSVQVMPLRIALACFIAYAMGQMLDVFVFQRYRNNSSWYMAPICSAISGNLIDTLVFFFVAFYHCSDPFLNQHWVEIALVDLCFKILISVLAFVPIYGLLLRLLGGFRKVRPLDNACTD